MGFTVGRWGRIGVRGITDPSLACRLDLTAHSGAARHGSELAVERLVQEGLLQFLQGGEFAFVEAGEVLGFD